MNIKRILVGISIVLYCSTSSLLFAQTTGILPPIKKVSLSKKEDFVNFITPLKKGDPKLTSEVCDLGSSFNWAAMNGDFDVARLLLERGVSPKAMSYGRPPIHCAAAYGRNDFIKFLVENGGDINQLDASDLIPISPASLNGHFQAVKFMVENGSKLNIPNTKFEWPRRNGNLELIKYLIEHGADPKREDNSLVFGAAIRGDIEVVRFLFAMGVKPVEKRKGFNLLHSAAVSGNGELVEFLLSQGYSINEVNDDGQTALWLAVDKNRIEAVKILLSRGADKTIADKQGRKAINVSRDSEISNLLK